ncbi:MAG: glycosyltransferase family 4 protein [Chloroflexota bacterium]
MRIAFNAQLLSFDQGYRSAGISRYTEHMLASLAPLLGGDSCYAFVGPGVPMDAPALGGLRVIRTGLPTERPIVRILWEQMVLPLALRRLNVDLVHAPAYVAPLAFPGASVVTFHDLSFYLMPDAFNRSNRVYLQNFSRWTARRARRSIAVSESTRQDMVRLLGVSPSTIDVVYNGIDECFRPEPDPRRIERFRQAKGLPERFILFLGTIEPRKNVPALVRAYARARQRGVSAPLVIAGGQGWGGESIAQIVEELGLAGTVRLTGFIPSDERPLWYNAATLFAYPSRYEGFGLPVAEAMACGTAVVASNRSSLPEVVGDAGALVDPDDVAALADALVTVAGDSALRRELAARGLERSQRFTWDAAARATLRSYRTALAVPPAALPGVKRD